MRQAAIVSGAAGEERGRKRGTSIGGREDTLKWDDYQSNGADSEGNRQ